MKQNRSVKEQVLRWIFFIAGLAIMAFGIAFSIIADLGTSPISSPPYVFSMFLPLTVGNLTICLHGILILLQILLLRKDYQWIQLLQLPVAIVFGYLCDLALYTVSGLSYTNYAEQWIYCFIGIVLVAIGVSMEVTADVVTLAGEGAAIALSKVTKISFTKMKVIFDVIMVIIAIIVSYFVLGSIQGVREGTVAAALLVGVIANPLIRLESKISFSNENLNKIDKIDMEKGMEI